MSKVTTASTPDSVTPPPRGSAILTAISNIMAEIGSVDKRGTNKFQDYKFAKASDILAKLQPLMAREGLVIIPSEVDREILEDGSLLAIRFDFILAHTSGEIWEHTTFGRPMQTGMARLRSERGSIDDKAANKCATAASKYFHIALFKIPTDDVDDADADGEIRAQPNYAGGKVRSEPNTRAPAAGRTDIAPALPPRPANDNAPKANLAGQIPPQNSWISWGKEFISGLEASAKLADVAALQASNVDLLAQAAREAPKVHARLMVQLIATKMARSVTQEEIESVWKAHDTDIQALPEKDYTGLQKVSDAHVDRVTGRVPNILGV